MSEFKVQLACRRSSIYRGIMPDALIIRRSEKKLWKVMFICSHSLAISTVIKMADKLCIHNLKTEHLLCTL